MRPSLSWGAIALSGAGNDYRQAWEITKQQVGDVRGQFVDDMVRTTMRRFVRDEWGRIVQLGNVLMSAPGQELTYEECLTVLGHERDIVSVLISMRSQSPRPKSVN
jgi:hypothetical protein